MGWKRYMHHTYADRCPEKGLPIYCCRCCCFCLASLFQQHVTYAVCRHSWCSIINSLLPLKDFGDFHPADKG